MQQQEQIKIVGKLKLVLTKDSGDIQEYEYKNLVVNAGLNLICQRLKDDLTVVPSHMAVGSSATAPAGGQTALLGELGRVALSSVAVSSNQIEFDATFPPGTATGTINEAGIFNDVSAGTMLSRSLFLAAIPKGAGDSLAVIWTLTFSAV